MVLSMNCSLTSIVAGEIPACSHRVCKWHTRKSLWSLISLVAKVKYHSGCDNDIDQQHSGQNTVKREWRRRRTCLVESVGGLVGQKVELEALVHEIHQQVGGRTVGFDGITGI